MNVDLSDEDLFVHQQSGIVRLFKRIGRNYQRFLDKLVPFSLIRWLSTFFLLALFSFRVIYFNGWYVVAYCLAIYILTQSLLFISPKQDPDNVSSFLYGDTPYDNGETDPGPGLPIFEGVKKGETFAPFMRKLPEFKFWYRLTKAFVISLFFTLSRAFDIPVYVPILVVYFITLCILQFRKKVQHMIKYGYVPWTKGKKKGGKGLKK